MNTNPFDNRFPPASSSAVRGWPGTPGKGRILLIEDQVPLRQTAGDFGPVISMLSAGTEADVGRLLKANGQQWVEVVLANGMGGFIAGGARSRVFKNVTLKARQTEMLAKPGDPSSLIRYITRGEKFLIMGTAQSGAVPELGGYMIWEWTPNVGGATDRGFTPQGKPAEEVLRDWLARPSWNVGS